MTNQDPVLLHPTEDLVVATANPLLYPGDLDTTASFAADVLVVLVNTDFGEYEGVPTGFNCGVHMILSWVADSLRKQAEIDQGASEGPTLKEEIAAALETAGDDLGIALERCDALASVIQAEQNGSTLNDFPIGVMSNILTAEIRRAQELQNQPTGEDKS